MTKNIIYHNNEKFKNVQHKINSFVRRFRRLTKGQQHAIDNLWSTMVIDYQSNQIDFKTIFGRAAPVIFEIGFGMGSSLVNMATTSPEYNFIGIEVYLPGIGACLAKAHKAGVKNLRIIYHDAVEVLEKMIPNESITLIQLFFPDPWHKTKHNKRRIIKSQFVALLIDKLSDGGIFHIATDWQSYAKYMLTVISNNPFFKNLSTTGDYIPRPKNRPFTKFERRGKLLGHSVWDLMFVKKIENFRD